MTNKVISFFVPSHDQIIGPFSGRQLDFSLLVTRIGGDGAKAGKFNDLALDFFVYFCIFVGHI